MPAQEYNSGKHIDEVIEQTTCDNHNAPEGKPCFSVYFDPERNAEGCGVCGNRIKRAGFNGEINPSSLSRSVTKHQSSPRR